MGRLGDQAAVLRQRMQDAMTSGNEAAFWRTARAADELAKKQAIAAARAREARDAVTTQAAALSRLRAASASAATAQEKIGKALEDATKNHKKLEDAAAKEKGTGNLGKMSSALGSLGGPVGSLGSRAAGLADAFGNLKGAMGAAPAVAAGAAIAIAALVAVVVALGAATLVGAVNLGRWSIGLSDAARSSSLLSAGIARTVAGGKQLDATIASLQDRVPLARDELVSMASDLAKTGLRGDALSAALENAAVKAAKLKLGPEFEKELLSIQSQSSRLDRHLSKLFKLDIEPLLQGFSKLVALFDPMSVTGKAIQTVYQDIASRVLNRIVDFIPKIVAGFIQVQIWVLKALIAIKPFGPTILEIGKFFLTMGAVALGVVGFIVAQVMLAVASVLALQAGIALLGKMIVDKLVGAINKLRSMSLEDIGRAARGARQGVMAGLVPVDRVRIRRDDRRSEARAWDQVAFARDGAEIGAPWLRALAWVSTRRPARFRMRWRAGPIPQVSRPAAARAAQRAQRTIFTSPWRGAATRRILPSAFVTSSRRSSPATPPSSRPDDGGGHPRHVTGMACERSGGWPSVVNGQAPVLKHLRRQPLFHVFRPLPSDFVKGSFHSADPYEKFSP